MDRAFFSGKLAALIVIAGFIFYAHVHRSPSGPSGDYAATVANDNASISIAANGETIGTITLADIPSFDSDDDSGTPATPSTDYLFAPDTLIDASRSLLYFSVYNETTAGNANADRALFLYDIPEKKLTLLANESYTASFGILEASADGRFLVYSEGTEEGLCYDVMGLGIYDLRSMTSTADIFLPDGVTGYITFDHWLSSSSFVYDEATYPSVNACLRDGDSSPHVVGKTYRL